MTNFTRTIPTEIRNQLRKEVNFGCPVQDCGIPFLTYHHFSPTFKELLASKNPEHNPAGIIALCHTHADQADGNAWSVEQLKQMKKNPFLTGTKRNARFHYKRDQIVVRAGHLSIGVAKILKLDNEEVIGFEINSNGELGLNLLVKDSKGEVILKMENNDWTVFTDTIFNLNCTAQGKELELTANDNITRFKIKYNELSLNGLKTKLRPFGTTKIRSLISELKNKNRILLLTLTGKINYCGSPITFTENSFAYHSPHMNIEQHGVFFKNFSSFEFNNGSYLMRAIPGAEMHT